MIALLALLTFSGCSEYELLTNPPETDVPSDPGWEVTANGWESLETAPIGDFDPAIDEDTLGPDAIPPEGFDPYVPPVEGVPIDPEDRAGPDDPVDPDAPDDPFDPLGNDGRFDPIHRGEPGDPWGVARMTGGGGIEGEGFDVSHGFTLHCAGSHHANRLVIHWEEGVFHLDDVDWVVCLDDPALEPGMPEQLFDTVVGAGFGTLDDGTEVDVWFLLTDDGETGETDALDFDLVWPDGSRYSASGPLSQGNHQVHDPVHP